MDFSFVSDYVLPILALITFASSVPGYWKKCSGIITKRRMKNRKEEENLAKNLKSSPLVVQMTYFLTQLMKHLMFIIYWLIVGSIWAITYLMARYDATTGHVVLAAFSFCLLNASIRIGLFLGLIRIKFSLYRETNPDDVVNPEDCVTNEKPVAIDK